MSSTTMTLEKIAEIEAIAKQHSDSDTPTLLWSADVLALCTLARRSLERPVAGTTADGVTVRVGDRVWWSNGSEPAMPNMTDGVWYSTEQAARAAAEV